MTRTTTLRVRWSLKSFATRICPTALLRKLLRSRHQLEKCIAFASMVQEEQILSCANWKIGSLRRGCCKYQESPMSFRLEGQSSSIRSKSRHYRSQSMD